MCVKTLQNIYHTILKLAWKSSSKYFTSSLTYTHAYYTELRICCPHKQNNYIFTIQKHKGLRYAMQKCLPLASWELKWGWLKYWDQHFLYYPLGTSNYKDSYEATKIEINIPFVIRLLLLLSGNNIHVHVQLLHM